MKNNEIKKDFGLVLLKNKTEINEQLETYMSTNGYNVDYCDICSVIHKTVDERDVVLFKFVHYSIPTMNTEPYYRIEFGYI